MAKIDMIDPVLLDQVISDLGVEWLLATNNTVQQMVNNINHAKYKEHDNLQLKLLNYIGTKQLQTIFIDYNTLNIFFNTDLNTQTQLHFLNLLGDDYVKSLKSSHSDPLYLLVTILHRNTDVNIITEIFDKFDFDHSYLLTQFPDQKKLITFIVNIKPLTSSCKSDKIDILIERMMPHLAARLAVKDIYELLTYLSHDYYPKFIAHLLLKKTLPPFSTLLDKARDTIYENDTPAWFIALPSTLYEENLVDFKTFQKATWYLSYKNTNILYQKLSCERLRDIFYDGILFTNTELYNDKYSFSCLIEKLGKEHLFRIIPNQAIYNYVYDNLLSECQALLAEKMQAFAYTKKMDARSDIMQQLGLFSWPAKKLYNPSIEELKKYATQEAAIFMLPHRRKNMVKKFGDTLKTFFTDSYTGLINENALSEFLASLKEDLGSRELIHHKNFSDELLANVKCHNASIRSGHRVSLDCG